MGIAVNVEGQLASEVSERLAAYLTLSGATPHGLVPGGTGPVEGHEQVARRHDRAGVECVNISLPIAMEVSLEEYNDRQRSGHAVALLPRR